MNLAVIGSGGREHSICYKLKDKCSKDFVNVLWECCQIPDFSKKAYGNHIEVVKRVFEFLTSKSGKVTNEYMKKQLEHLDRYEGNIDTLANRISNVRTWSYVANKKKLGHQLRLLD